MSAFVEQGIDRYEVGFAQKRVHIGHGHPERIDRGLRNIRVAAEQTHVERLRQPEDLGADVANANHSQRAAHQPHAEIIAFLRPAALSNQPVLEKHAMRQR